MTDTTAQIRAKGLEATGITEELARKYFDNLGSHHMAIVELKVDSRTIDSDGHQKVHLVLTQVEPAESDTADRHLRDLTKALFMNRRLHDEDYQPTLDNTDANEPTVEQVTAAGENRLLERDADGEPRLWDGTTDPDDADGSRDYPDGEPAADAEVPLNQRPADNLVQFTGSTAKNKT